MVVREKLPPKRDFRIWGILFTLVLLFDIYAHYAGYKLQMLVSQGQSDQIEFYSSILSSYYWISIPISPLFMSVYLYFNFRDIKKIHSLTSSDDFRFPAIVMAVWSYPIVVELLYVFVEISLDLGIFQIYLYILLTILFPVIPIFIKFNSLEKELGEIGNKKNIFLNPYLRFFLGVSLFSPFVELHFTDILFWIVVIFGMLSIYFDYKWQKSMNELIILNGG